MANTPTVKHISECFIKPKSEPKDAINPLYLAPYDLAMLSVHYIQKGLLFPKPSPFNVHDLIENLKHSLSIALVHFYPLAGQFETKVDEDEHTSLIFINPNKGPGAKLIHASLHMRVSEILSSQYTPRVVQSFFDHDRAVNHDGHTKPLLSIQVTELLDGVFIGCSLNHACADGTSYWHFFNTFSEIFMSNPQDNKNVISRPPIHKKWFINNTGPIIKLPFAHPDEFVSPFEAPELKERIFHFSTESIAKLKAKANNNNNNNISSFQALSGLVWRCITRARCFPDDVETRCRLAINNRGRLDPPLPSNYYGNSIQTVQGSSKAGELLRGDLGYAALLLHEAVAGHSDRKTREFLESWMGAPFVYQLSFFDPCSVMMGSSPRFDMYGNEFGMGKGLAVLSGYANKFDGKVTSYPGRDGGGSVDLEMCLLPEYMCKLELDEEFMEAAEGCC